MTTNKTAEAKALELISQAAELLGWQIAFDGTADEVRYMIIGEPEYVNDIVNILEK